jgi:hypothetical protein
MVGVFLLSRSRSDYSRKVAKYFPMLQCDRPANEKLVAVGGEATERGQFRIRPTAASRFYPQPGLARGASCVCDRAPTAYSRWQSPLMLSCTVNCTRIGNGPGDVVRFAKITSQRASRSTGPVSALNELGTRLPSLDDNSNL